MVYLNKGLLQSNKRRNTCNNDGFQKHYFEQQKLYTKEYMVLDYIYMKFKNKQQEPKIHKSVGGEEPRAGEGNKKGVLWSVELFYILTLVVITWMFACIKINPDVYLNVSVFYYVIISLNNNNGNKFHYCAITTSVINLSLGNAHSY